MENMELSVGQFANSGIASDVTISDNNKGMTIIGHYMIRLKVGLIVLYIRVS